MEDTYAFEGENHILDSDGYRSTVSMIHLLKREGVGGGGGGVEKPTLAFRVLEENATIFEDLYPDLSVALQRSRDVEGWIDVEGKGEVNTYELQARLHGFSNVLVDGA